MPANRGQNALFPFVNALRTRISDEFFRSVPAKPGIYKMYSSDDFLLYVGKAKSLRTRLLSYRRLNPSNCSRKVIRLLNAVERVEYLETTSEQEALLLENKLLRSLKPPMNVLNTRPENYYFIYFKSVCSSLHMKLGTNPELGSEDSLYGSFKGRSVTRRGFLSLSRLLWRAMCDRPIPNRLLSDRPLYDIQWNFEAEDLKFWSYWARRFLKGNSRKLLDHLSEKIQASDLSYEDFCLKFDLDFLEDFYAYGPRRNRHLKMRLKEKGSSHLLSQDEIDDLLVRANFI